MTLARQLLTDLIVCAWVTAWVRLSMWVYDLVKQLGVPGEKLEGAGGDLAENLAGASDKVDGIPGIGGGLSSQLEKAARASEGLQAAGVQQQQAVDDLALTLAVLLVVVPIGLVVLVWLPLRLRWIRRASAAARLRGDETGKDLLALRALANQPLGRLRTLDPAIAAAWRNGDEPAIERLADLELRDLGLKQWQVR